MRRRDFIKGMAGSAAATWPLAALAQQTDHVRRIGVLLPAASNRIQTIRLGTARSYRRWRNWVRPSAAMCGSTSRWAPNTADIRRAAPELIALAPDVILAHGAGALAPLLQATRTVPIVFPVIADPVAAANSSKASARPGGNATGFMLFENSISGKWLELLKQVAPGVKRVIVLWEAQHHRPSSIQRYSGRGAVA